MNNMFAIVEIGSNNTKTHIYKDEDVIYENTTTIEFKKNYKNENKINENDLNILYEVIINTLNYTKNISIYGCSIFRNISAEEINKMARYLGVQFIIATHSPFMLGILNAKIYNLDTENYRVEKWSELENVRYFYDFFKSRKNEFEK